MIGRLPLLFFFSIALFTAGVAAQSRSFVSVKGHNFYIKGSQYYFVGTNYWYGSLLRLEKHKNAARRGLRRELDFLKANGVTNLRLMAGAEGSGPINGVTRVGPPLQPEMGRFDEKVLGRLDRVLYEMGVRARRRAIFV